MPSPWVQRALAGELACKSFDSFVPAKAGEADRCHQDCSRCWLDFVEDRATNHACDCDACTPKLPSDHRWVDWCDCRMCLPE